MFEENPEKGAWAYPGTAQNLGTPYYRKNR